MPISHLSGRARHTIHLEVSALCLVKLLGENGREMQVISVIQLRLGFEIRTPLTHANS